MPKKKTKWVWKINTATYLEIIKLARHHDKKAGDSMEWEFKEILKEQKRVNNLMGPSEEDIDEMIENMPEENKQMPDMEGE